MSTLLVQVCRIEKVLTHPNADALELAHIKGWQCVVPKGKYAAEALVVYVPIDSVLPLELSDRLGVTKYLSSKGRVRCAKLRGEPSFGLIFDREDASWPEGHDVAEHYGVTKYQPPVKATAGDAAVAHPLFVSYTDVENLRHFPGIFPPDEQVSLTEKIHGTSCRIGIIDGEVMAGSMGLRRKRPEPDQAAASIYWAPASQPGVMALLSELAAAHKQVILFGEVYGAKVQSLGYGKPGASGFVAFDLFADGRFLDVDDFQERCKRHGVPMVPELARGPFSWDLVYAHGKGQTTLGANHIREGVVVKPLRERLDPKLGRVILKYISDDYLLNKGISDSEDV